MFKKTLQKISAVALSAIMVFGAAMPAAAATLDFSSEKNEGHTYAIYQIFTGDYTKNTDGSEELENIKWGQNGTGTAGAVVSSSILEALTAVSNGTDAEKLAEITKYADLTGTPVKTSADIDDDDQITGLTPGYYLIKDSTEPTGDSYTLYVVEVVGGDDAISITPKSEKPTFDKQVLDNDSDDTSAVGGKVTQAADDLGHLEGVWGETADHSIGEVFQFRLVATLPSNANIDKYTSYKMVFSDTLSKEITYDGGLTVVVTKSDGSKITLTKGTDYTVTGEPGTSDSTSDQSFTVTINNLKSEGILGADGSLQGVTVEVFYKAHLNSSAVVGDSDENTNKAKLTYSNNPNKGGEGDTEDTPEDTVFVFTYDFDNFKTKEDGTTALPGAKFSIYKSGSSEAIKLVKVSDGVYRAATAADATTTTVMESPTDGKFKITGLDAGTYTLKETSAPSGYDAADDMTITLTATHGETDKTGASASTTLTRKLGDKEFTTNTIINRRGSKLPQTGGMGTTLLYVVGGILVVGAGTTLAGKKRLGKNEDK